MPGTNQRSLNGGWYLLLINNIVNYTEKLIFFHLCYLVGNQMLPFLPCHSIILLSVLLLRHLTYLCLDCNNQLLVDGPLWSPFIRCVVTEAIFLFRYGSWSLGSTTLLGFPSLSYLVPYMVIFHYSFLLTSSQTWECVLRHMFSCCLNWHSGLLRSHPHLSLIGQFDRLSPASCLCFP